jgi:hypothetical protein
VTSTRRTLRVETPVLEPDDALVARMADAARHSVATAPRRRRLGDWRVVVAAAALAAVTMGGAYAAGVIGPLPVPEQRDRSPSEPTPGGESEPVPASTTGDGTTGDTEPPVGRPTDQPTEGAGGPTDRPTGPPSGVPTGQPSGLPSDHPTGPPSGLPTPSHPTGQPSTPGRPSGLPSATPTKKPAAHATQPSVEVPSPVRPSPWGGP